MFFGLLLRPATEKKKAEIDNSCNWLILLYPSAQDLWTPEENPALSDLLGHIIWEVHNPISHAYQKWIWFCAWDLQEAQFSSFPGRNLQDKEATSV